MAFPRVVCRGVELRTSAGRSWIGDVEGYRVHVWLDAETNEVHGDLRDVAGLPVISATGAQLQNVADSLAATIGRLARGASQLPPGGSARG